MAFLTNLFLIPVRALAVLGGGLLDLLGLVALLAGAARGRDGEGDGSERVIHALTSARGQRRLFGVLRVFWSNVVFGRRLVSAYANAGTAVVTRWADVIEVLERERDFAVVYEPRLRRLTAGENLFPGMQDSPAHQHDLSVMRLAARWEDVPRVLQPFVAARADDVIAAAGARVDVPAELTLPVTARMLGHYLGTPGPSEWELIRWATVMNWYLFADLGADPDVEREALVAAKACRAYLDDVIAARKAAPTDADDVLNRCLDLQRAGSLGLDDVAIRNNLMGLIIGALPTLSKAAVNALDQLLDRPEALAGAREAARRRDLDALGRHVFEALRFNPVNSVVYRRAVRDCTIAQGTLRERHIPQDSIVFAATLGAMFDGWHLARPRAFRTDRPWEHYLLWGHGLHTCFGRHINRAVVPTLLRALLAVVDIRRAPGAAGRIDCAGTPFPAHLVVETGRR